MADPLRSLAACVLGSLLALAWLAPLVANDKPLWADARDVQAAQLAQEELGAALDQYRTALAADATAVQASTAWTELERAWEQAAARSSASQSDVARVCSTMTECAGRPERLVDVQRLLAPWLGNVELPRVRRMVGSPVLASVDSGALLRLALLPVLACLVFWTARGRLPGRHRLWWALGLAASTVLVWFGLQAVQQPELVPRDADHLLVSGEQMAQLDQAPIMQSTGCIEGEADGTVVGSSVGEAVVGLRTNNNAL